MLITMMTKVKKGLFGDENHDTYGEDKKEMIIMIVVMIGIVIRLL